MINVTSVRGKQKARAEILRAMTLLEMSAARDIRPILNRQFLSAARSVAVGSYNVNAAVNSQRGKMIVTFKRHYRRTATVFNQMAMGKLGAAGAIAGQVLPVSDIGEIVPEVKGSREEFWSALNASIDKDTAKRVTNVGKTTKKRIQNVIKRGMTSKLSNREIAKNLRGISAIANPKRAKVIARTETHGAAMQAIDESVKTAGVKTTKDWIAANDKRSRDIPGRGRIHVQAMATQKKIPDDKPFIVGGEKLMYPGDFSGSGWNVINCRCAVIYDVVKAAVVAKPKPKPVVEGKIRDLENEALEYGKRTGKELSNMVDLKSGENMIPISGSGSKIDIEKQLRAIKPGRKYAQIHNHITENSFSDMDLVVFGNHFDLEEMRAITRTSRYIVKKKAKKLFIKDIEKFRMEYHGNMVDLTGKWARKSVNKALSMVQTNKMLFEELNRKMAKRFGYTFKVEKLK